MGFADAYLQKHSFRKPFLSERHESEINIIIAIPAFQESRLEMCLDSLFNCEPSGIKSEVLVLINIPENSSDSSRRQNQEYYQNALDWIKEHQKDDMQFHILFADKLPQKHFGAGLARKIVMDEAVNRFNQIDNSDGIIVSLDADTLVSPNYVRAISNHFKKHPEASGASIHFEHPLEGSEFAPEVYSSILNYEIHLRYYLHALRYTTYPYAFHTIGSCFAVKAATYCREGGLSKRKAGEDFYFIQKVAMQGKYTECNSCTVYPSPRPSNRVPFGTGPEIIRQMENKDLPYLTFDPELFEHLKAFYTTASQLYKKTEKNAFLMHLDRCLQDYLQATDFTTELQEILQNVASESAFQKRFLMKFNMFWILKYLHFAESQGYEKMEVGNAARTLLEMMHVNIHPTDKRLLLESYRTLALKNQGEVF